MKGDIVYSVGTGWCIHCGLRYDRFRRGASVSDLNFTCKRCKRLVKPPKLQAVTEKRNADV